MRFDNLPIQSPKTFSPPARIFIGLTIGSAFTPEILKNLAKDSIVFAMANPNPEATYVDMKAAGIRVAGTGRSDAPNQINNVAVFPGVFRGAFDVRASQINDKMKLFQRWVSCKMKLNS